MEKANKLLYNSAIQILVTLSMLVLVTSILWLLKIPMMWFYLPICYIVTIAIQIFAFKTDKKNIFLTSILSIAIIIICLLLSGHVYDQSDDGNSYHKETIGLISHKWNPIYDDYDEYAIIHNYPHNHAMWAKHYPKTTWIIGSGFYMLTGNIETAKAYNCIFMFVGFFILYKGLYELTKKKIISIIISGICIFNPVSLSQVISLYIDGSLGILLFIVILEMLILIKKERNNEFNFIMGSSLLLIINIKFTGLAYAGVFCLGYYIYYVIKSIRKKEYKVLKNTTLYFVAIVLTSFLIVGSNSYIKNTLTNGHPFYPLMGKNKVDIMTYLQPASFQKMSPIQKNYYAIFSKTADIGMYNNGEPTLKIPFTFDEYELSQYGYDTRIGGYGIFFSGIFIISIIIIVISIIKLLIKKEYDNLILLFIPLITIILLLFFLSDGWWARYAPYLYLTVIISLIMLSNYKNKVLKILLGLFVILIYSNSFISFRQLVHKDMPKSGMTRNTLKELHGSNLDIYLGSDRFTGILFNLEDHHIEYKIITSKTNEMNNLYGTFAYYKNVED